MLELLAVALAIPLGVVALLTAYSHFFGGGMVWPEELRPTPEPPGQLAPPGLPTSKSQLRTMRSQGLVVLAPNTVPVAYPRTALDRSDELFLELQYSGSRTEDGLVVLRAVQRFLRRGDVLARRVSNVDAYGTSWNPFVGKTDPHWFVKTEWCLRFHFPPGEELEFVQVLWQLGQEPYGDFLGLPQRHNVTGTPAAGEAGYVDPHAWQNLLLPVQTSWSGDGPFGERIKRLNWQLLPDSDICATARQQAAAPAPIAR